MVAAALATPGAASAAGPCDGQPHYGWMGDSVSTTVSIPSLTQPNGNAAYEGTILKPADDTAFPGPRPVVLLQHGLGGNQCAQFWSARDLAGHGYIAIVWTAPHGANQVEAFFNAVDAMRSAIAFVRGSQNPYLPNTDGSRIALAGHSLGSIVAGYVQQDADPGVRALIALDTLRRWVNGDPGGAVFECAAGQQLEITPRVPALGFAKDAPCDAKPDYAPVDLKLPGFDWWREHELPAVELVMAGYSHLDFATPGSEQKHRDLAGFMEAWLATWLLGDAGATDACSPAAWMSCSAPGSCRGRILPGRVESRDFRAFLADDVRPRPGRRTDRATRWVGTGRGVGFGSGSAPTMPRRASNAASTRANGRGVESGVRVKTGRGRHRFRVRATDPRGNVERTPAVEWRFTVNVPR